MKNDQKENWFSYLMHTSKDISGTTHFLLSRKISFWINKQQNKTLVLFVKDGLACELLVQSTLAYANNHIKLLIYEYQFESSFEIHKEKIQINQRWKDGSLSRI